ncbi:MAG: Rieske 2Fe-2S domain-containing protein [Phycisphaera sp.]|nr:Rieske 2Fe-2S domain-containing protein [Phycisphaera sp.]
MSVSYKSVQWNTHKRVYDTLLVGAVVAYVVGFVAMTSVVWSGNEALSPPVLVMRATGSCAAIMLTVILCIGPLARLDRRFAPLLYNRRHFGVTMFFIALLHGTAALGFYHGFGNVNPLVSLLTHGGDYGSFMRFPFQVLGAMALVILFFMAATSHDFWLKNLSPPVWKALHMLVYLAFALVVMHVALGVLQKEKSPVYIVIVFTAVVLVTTLHVVAGAREIKPSLSRGSTETSGGLIDAGPASDIPDGRAMVVCVKDGQRVAIYRHGDKISALSNVCAHQNGPLGEGKIVDGCVTCPWHGYQYLPHNGCSPPPFTEKVPTYNVRVVKGHVMLDPTPLPPGTPVDPARITESDHA